MERFFELMGKRREEYVELLPCDPIYSFITEDGRGSSYPTDIDKTTKVIESIAPEDVEGWKRFSSPGFGLIEKTMNAMMLNPMKALPEALSMILKSPRPCASCRS